MNISVIIPKIKIVSVIKDTKALITINNINPIFKTPFVVTTNEATGKEVVIVVDNLNLLCTQGDSGYIL